MTNVIQFPLAKGRERLPSVLLAPLPSRVGAALRGASDLWPVRELAPPPAGSGLERVHKCIGLHFGTLEVKAILHHMLRTYNWTVPDQYEARWDNTSLPIPVDGLPITMERR